eukprot:MONOS_8670.1-p1 / transcript=MONOS_8670.1 / gene=MONOS_8670 / organism=Monocercomonoides_exilis_PA203 / gene_product=unspecified product / transcript_product=unspecified product / location=Mono_scaffold00333:38099-39679(+) / protein_length=283 / sequence_SO=supercontig / SO=protein_coding / is_pseudo=false
MDELAEEEKLMEKITVSTEGFGPTGLQTLLVGLKSYNFVHTFCFWNCGLGDDGLLLIIEFIRNNPVVLSLELLDNITPVGCAPGTTMLNSLTLDHSGIGDEGAALLSTGISAYAPMKRLSLNYCSIGAAGGVALMQNLFSESSKCKLEYISLQGNVCGPQTLAMLGHQLPFTTSLAVINLADNGIGDDEEPLELFRAGLLANTSVQEINLDLNMIGDKAATQFLEVIGGPRQDIVEFKVTERLSPTVFADVLKVVEANKIEAIARAARNRPKKKKGKKKKKK